MVESDMVYHVSLIPTMHIGSECHTMFRFQEVFKLKFVRSIAEALQIPKHRVKVQLASFREGSIGTWIWVKMGSFNVEI